jgi:predicted dehydrogenase
MAELGSHQITAASWFLDSAPEAVYTSGSISRYKDGREVNDHIFSTFEYPGGRTATFTSIQSNAFEEAYEMFMGTKGTLILKTETEAYLFTEGDAQLPTKVETSKQGSNPILDASASRPPDAAGRTVNAPTTGQNDKGSAYQNEQAEFCASIRTGKPVRCGPEKAMKSAIACLTANRSAEQKARLVIGGGE